MDAKGIKKISDEAKKQKRWERSEEGLRQRAAQQRRQQEEEEQERKRALQISVENYLRTLEQDLEEAAGQADQPFLTFIDLDVSFTQEVYRALTSRGFLVDWSTPSQAFEPIDDDHGVQHREVQCLKIFWDEEDYNRLVRNPARRYRALLFFLTLIVILGAVFMWYDLKEKRLPVRFDAAVESSGHN